MEVMVIYVWQCMVVLLYDCICPLHTHCTHIAIHRGIGLYSNTTHTRTRTPAHTLLLTNSTTHMAA